MGDIGKHGCPTPIYIWQTRSYQEATVKQTNEMISKPTQQSAIAFMMLKVAFNKRLYLQIFSCLSTIKFTATIRTEQWLPLLVRVSQCGRHYLLKRWNLFKRYSPAQQQVVYLFQWSSVCVCVGCQRELGWVKHKAFTQTPWMARRGHSKMIFM